MTTSCLVTSGRDRFLYYTGWSRGVTVPFYLAAGVAISETSGPFERWSLAPLLERSAVDPFLTASPFVLDRDGRWRMWYVSATEWRQTESGPRHYYHIRYAESADGFAWRRDGQVCRRLRDAGRTRLCAAVGRARRRPLPHVVRRARRRATGSRSPSRLTASAGRGATTLGLTAGPEDWESEMVEYPCVFDWDGRRFMLYNGNDYGRTGVGLAVLEDS